MLLLGVHLLCKTAIVSNLNIYATSCHLKGSSVTPVASSPRSKTGQARHVTELKRPGMYYNLRLSLSAVTKFSIKYYDILSSMALG